MLHLVGKGNREATLPLTVPVPGDLEALAVGVPLRDAQILARHADPEWERRGSSAAPDPPVGCSY